MNTILNIDPFTRGDLSPYALYCSLFGIYPNTLDDRHYYKKEVIDAIISYYQSRPHFNQLQKFEFEEEDVVPCERSYLIWAQNILVQIYRLDNGYSVEFMYSDDKNVLDDFLALICPFRIIANDKPRFYMVVNRSRCLDLEEFDIRSANIDVSKYYNDDFQLVHMEIESFLNESRSGLVVLHGKQGTGKTSYIRRLIYNCDKEKEVIFMNGEMVHIMASPQFIPFILEHKDSIIVIEDCEELLAARTGNSSVNAGLINILNISDGLLSDALRIKFICTFNAPLKDIDKALLRKGRLVARYEFGDLEPKKANAIITEQGLNIPMQTVPITLADLFNYEKPTFEQQRKSMGF